MRFQLIFLILLFFFSSYGQRNFNFSNYVQKDVDQSLKTGVFLTYGQSNTVNSAERGYVVKNNVYQFVLGSTYIYKDPSLGVNGDKGSVWGMLGDKLIDNDIYENVVFSNCGIGGKKISELNREPIISFLISNYKSLINTFGKVDGILFHQGESDNKLSTEETYYVEFVEFLEILKNNGIEIPIYLSRASVCAKNPINYKLTDVQEKLINDFEIIKKGPNTDILINKKYRRDNCHFSRIGLEIYSDMWMYYILKETNNIFIIK